MYFSAYTVISKGVTYWIVREKVRVGRREPGEPKDELFFWQEVMLVHRESRWQDQNLHVNCGFQADWLHLPSLISRTPEDRLFKLIRWYMQGWATVGLQSWVHESEFILVLLVIIVLLQTTVNLVCPPLHYSSDISPTTHSHLEGNTPLFSTACHSFSFLRTKERVNDFHSKVECIVSSIQNSPPLFGLKSVGKRFHLEFTHNSLEAESTDSQRVNAVCRLSDPAMRWLPRLFSGLCLSVLPVIGLTLQRVFFFGLIYAYYIVYAAKCYTKMVFTV